MKPLNTVFQFNYDPEADVLSWEVSDAPIAYASEVGDMVVHFSQDHTPVYVEVLQARKFMHRAEQAVGAERVHAAHAFA